MRKNKAPDQGGFTLIELLITLVVLSFGLLGLAGLQAQMIRSNGFNGNLTIATSIGTDLLEEAEAAPWDGSGNILLFVPDPKDQFYPAVYGDTDDDGIADKDLDGDGNPDDPYGRRFTWTRTLTYGPGNAFVTVDVSVFWSDPLPHRLDLRTVVEARS